MDSPLPAGTILGLASSAFGPGSILGRAWEWTGHSMPLSAHNNTCTFLGPVSGPVIFPLMFDPVPVSQWMRGGLSGAPGQGQMGSNSGGWRIGIWPILKVLAPPVPTKPSAPVGKT